MLFYFKKFEFQFKLYSIQNIIVQNIMCKLNLTVNFVFNDTDYFRQESLSLDPVSIEEQALNHSDFVVIEDIHRIEIMTLLKNVDIGKYFSFFLLMEYYVS